MKLSYVAASIAFSLPMAFSGTAAAQDYSWVDADTYEYCQDRAERRSGYYGRTPDRDKKGGVVEGAIGGAILGSIFSDKKEDAAAGAILGGIFGGIERERQKDLEAQRRRDYRYEFDACINRRR